MIGGFCFNCGKPLPDDGHNKSNIQYFRVLIRKEHRGSLVGITIHNTGSAYFCDNECFVTGMPKLIERFKHDSSKPE